MGKEQEGKLENRYDAEYLIKDIMSIIE